MKSKLEGSAVAEAWPPFHLDERSIANLARYVNEQSVSQLGLGVGDAFTRRDQKGTEDVAGLIEENKRTVAVAYEHVASRRYPYNLEPPRFDQSIQLIRTPRELDAYAGTCIDFAILFASLCMSERVACLLIVRASETDGHAWLLVDLGRRDNLLSVPAEDGLGKALVDGTGQTRISGNQLQEIVNCNSRYLTLDPTVAANTGRHRDFSRAVSKGFDELSIGSADVTVVDIALIRETVGPPHDLPSPDLRPVIGRQLPTSTRFETYGKVRSDALARVLSSRSSIAIIGESAMGKSMMALQAAATAVGGYGWFLNASSRSALIESLGRAEAREQFGVDFQLSQMQLSELASEAKRRLQETNVPWMLVIDNANLGGDDVTTPSEILAILPTPRADCGQRMIVTSTNDAWKKHMEAVTLAPIDSRIIGLDGLGVEGRPLFVAAYRRLCEATQRNPEALASLIPKASIDADGPELFWLLCRTLFADNENLLNMARTAAWAPPDRLSGSALASTSGAGNAAFSQLCESGLVEPVGGREGRMHRLIGAAIRKQGLADQPEATIDTLFSLVESPVDIDSETADLIAPVLASAIDLGGSVCEVAAKTLCALGARVEKLLGAVPANNMLQRALPGLKAEDHRRRAECIHSSARDVYQNKKRKDTLEVALIDIGQCLDLRNSALLEAPSSNQDLLVELKVELLRSVALRGLIKVELANLIQSESSDLTPERTERARTLADEGNRDVDDSLEQRMVLIGDPDDEDVLRGRFNQAMASISLGKNESDRCLREAHFARAYSGYDEVGSARQRMRPRAPKPHIASCFAGLALVQYFRAVDVLVFDGLGDGKALSDKLREASHQLQQALAIREQIEDADFNEVEKTARLEAKIALARWSVALARRGNTADIEKMRAELQTELANLGEVWWP